MSNLTKIDVDVASGAVRVGTGAIGSMVDVALKERGPPGAAFPAGDCPWLGVAGYNLGGGIGVLSRYLGLGCDQLVGLTMVNAVGNMVTASKTQNSDLLWASCGGGGGTFGIVTELRFRLRVLPNGGSVTAVRVEYSRGTSAMVTAFMRYQDWLPSMDSRFGGMVKWVNQAMLIEFVFLGPPEEARALMTAAGMLALPTQSATFTPLPSYFDYQKHDVESFWLAEAIQALPNGTDIPDFVLRTMRGEPAYRIQPGSGPTWFYTKNRVVNKLPLRAVKAAAAFALSQERLLEGTAYTFLVQWWVLGGGGAVADLAPNATAFFHRQAWAVMAAEFYSDNFYRNFPIKFQSVGVAAINGVFGAIAPYLPADKFEYNNYMSEEAAGWQQAYWGTNYPRLAQIKSRYDPLNVFGKPNTVRPAPPGPPPPARRPPPPRKRPPPPHADRPRPPPRRTKRQ